MTRTSTRQLLKLCQTSSVHACICVVLPVISVLDMCVFGWGQGSGALWLSGYSSTTCQGHEVFPNSGLYVWLLGRGRLGVVVGGQLVHFLLSVCLILCCVFNPGSHTFELTFFLNRPFPFTLTRVSICVRNTGEE